MNDHEAAGLIATCLQRAIADTRAEPARATRASSGDLQPGDLVVLPGPGHVGICIGGDQYVQAPHTGDLVEVGRFSTHPGDAGAARP